MNKDKSIKDLKQYIFKLKNQLEYSKIRVCHLEKENKNLQQELQRKDNIINELKKWCNECLEDHRIAREEGQTTISDTFFEMVLDKIKELEK